MAPPTNPEIAIVMSPPDSSFSVDVRDSSPASKIAAVATPSGYFSLASTINARRNGTVNNTPIIPPMAEIFATSR